MTTAETLAKLYPSVEFSEAKGHRVDGYVNATVLAEILCTSRSRLLVYLREGLFLPDLRTHRLVLFREDRIEELKSKWENRLSAFPVSAPVKGVITQFGMMLPRVKPRKEVLERLILSRPKRRSRDSSWKTRKRYNLKDLAP